MTVDAGAAGLLGVVGMDGGQLVVADVGVEFCHHGVDSGGVGEVVSGGEAVLGIEADAEAGAVHRFDNLTQLRELGADVLAHPCHVFKAEAWSVGGLVEDLADAGDGLLEDGVVADSLMAAGMEDYPAGPDFGGEGHVVDQGLDALFQVHLVGGAHVDEVDGVEEGGGHPGFL